MHEQKDIFLIIILSKVLLCTGLVLTYSEAVFLIYISMYFCSFLLHMLQIKIQFRIKIFNQQ